MKSTKNVDKNKRKRSAASKIQMLIINSRFFHDHFWKCRPPLFELLLIIRHKSADPAFHVW